MRSTPNAGFSLLQMAMLVLVFSIIAVSLVPGGKGGADADKEAITLKHMKAIEAAMKGFMAKNLRRPCPADGGLPPSDDDFGLEADEPGACFDGTIEANFQGTVSTTGTLSNTLKTITSLGSTSGIIPGMHITGTDVTTDTYVSSINVSSAELTTDKIGGSNASRTLTFYGTVAGTVPTRTLGLPDEYGLDGYGRRITYVVDLRATRAGNSNLTTAPNSCQSIQNNGLPGAIQILNAATDTVAKENVMWALISYGKAGHGAFPANGSENVDRIDVSGGNDVIPVANAINAFLDPDERPANMSQQVFQNKLVRQAADDSSPYNTTVWYEDETKNTCCVGKACNLGFYMNLGSTGTADDTAGVALASGDINGDGIQDLVVGNYEYGDTTTPPATPRVWVIFGRKTGWPSNGAVDLTNDIINGTGTYGFYIENTSASIGKFGRVVATGDVNRDGYDDIIIGGVNVVVIFGKASFTSNKINTTTDMDLDGGGVLRGLWLTFSGNISTAQVLATADINGNGYKDIILSTGNGVVTNYIYVIYDRASWSSGPTGFTASAPYRWALTNAAFVASYGFRISCNASYPCAQSPNSLAAGDLNGDGKDDIVFGESTANSSHGRVYIIFGGDVNVSSGLRITVTLAAGIFAGGDANSATDNAGAILTGTSDNSIGKAVAVADMNGDGYKDIITNSDTHIFGYYGRAAGAGADCSSAWSNAADTCDLSDPTYTNFELDTDSNRATITSGIVFPDIIKAADLNNDGKMDLVLSSSSGDVNYDYAQYYGLTYVIMQPTTGWPNTGNLFYDDGDTTANDPLVDLEEIHTDFRTGSFSIQGEDRDDYSYIPLVTDLNGDGKNDLIIGSPGYETGANQGGVHVLWGRKSVPWDQENNLGTLFP